MACNTTAIDPQNALNISSSSLDSSQLIEVDFMDHENWLATSSGRQGKDTQLDIQTVLHLDINCNNNEFQVMRRSIVQRIEELKQVPQKFIDTRTFTRPKKRVSRPALETMLEVPIMQNREFSSPWFEKNNLSLRDNIDDVTISFLSDTDSTNETVCKSISPSINSPRISGVQIKVPAIENIKLFSSPWFTKENLQSLGDNIEDVSLTLASLTLTSDSDVLNQTFCKEDSTIINSSWHVPTIQGDEKNHLGCQYNTENEVLNTTFSYQCSAGQTSHEDNKDQENINATGLPTQDTRFPYKTVCIDMNATYDTEMMNNTLSCVDGRTVHRSISRHSGRTASCESGLDEDQQSSASDSSYSSTSKPMNIGDVQIIAHIQEESLKRTNSTPVRGYVNNTFFNSDHLPSPIVPNTNHGYQSDNSDHSSGESRAKSSGSSVRSSCSSSPYGSTNVLSNVNGNATYQQPATSQSRMPTSASTRPHQAVQRPTAPVTRQPENFRPWPSYSLRPPSICPSRANTVQPQGRPNSGIPRPQSRLPSRLPAPKIRSTNSRAATQQNK